MADHKMTAKRIGSGIYEYKGYRLANCGYHYPDHQIWWVAVNIRIGYITFFANSKKELMQKIDKDELEREES